jgi:hypothetical protein
MIVCAIASAEAARVVVERHYLHRRPSICHAFGLFVEGELRGVVTFGIPASRHMMVSVCRADPAKVIELNRLWVCDSLPRNTESAFVSRALGLLPPRIVASYADTAHGHFGYVYRALNFNYAGWSDMERKTPRFDYVTPGKHSRAAFRGGAGLACERVRRRPKVRYWLTTGNRRERLQLDRLCTWPRLSWKTQPPPGEIIT